MARNRTIYHVVPDVSGEAWVVTQEDDHAFRREFRTKDEAVQAAKERARDQEPSHVKVHEADGNLEYESTYGDDPSRPPN